MNIAVAEEMLEDQAGGGVADAEGVLQDIEGANVQNIEHIGVFVVKQRDAVVNDQILYMPLLGFEQIIRYCQNDIELVFYAKIPCPVNNFVVKIGFCINMVSKQAKTR